MQHKAVLEFLMNGSRSRELVALRIGNHWFELDNELVGDAGIGAFEISDQQGRALLNEVYDRMFPNIEVQPIVLWHSHVISVEPSQHDLMHLPEWCMYGEVFHVPTQRTTTYGNALQTGAEHIRIKDDSSLVLVESKE